MAKIQIPTVNEKLLNKYVRHSVYLEQLKKSEALHISQFLKQDTFPKLYQKLISDLSKVKNLETVGSIYKIKRLKKMLAATHKISVAGMVKAEKMLVNRLVNVSKFEARWNKNLIEKTVPLDIDMTMPSNEVLKQLVTMKPFEGHKLSTWMKGYSKAVQVSMFKQIKGGVSMGESLPQIGKRIEKALGYKTKQAQYIARTAVSSVVHNAREEVFKRNKDIVRKVQWIATLDDRTSLMCIDLDGKMFNPGGGIRPPAHFNCRSSVIPVTPSWQEFGVTDPPPATRASMNGAVPAKMTYKQWLKKQPKAVQVKVLGKKRAELYRSGRVKIDRFVGRDLRPLTLKQLARREGVKFKEVPQALTSRQQLLKVKDSFVKGIDTDYTKVFKKEFNELSAKFPKVARKLKSVEVVKHSQYVKKYGKGSLANAGKDIDKTWKIAFDGRMFGVDTEYDLAATLKGYKKRKILTSAKVESTFTHEFGHLVHRSLPKRAKDKIFDLHFGELMNRGHTKIIERQVSKYAGTSPGEMFAESFVQWRTGTMSPWSKKVMKLAGIK